METCDCGKPVHIQTWKKCKSCYNKARKILVRQSRAMGNCNCGEPAEISKTSECIGCYNKRKYTEREVAAGRTPYKPRPLTRGHRRLLTVRDLNQHASYVNAHQRVKSWRGKANEHQCVGCGVQAQSWAYRHGSTYEHVDTKTGPRGETLTVRYSVNPADYDPMCWTCHFHRDKTDKHNTTWKIEPRDASNDDARNIRAW